MRRILLGILLAIGLVLAQAESLNCRLIGQYKRPDSVRYYGIARVIGNLVYLPAVDSGLEIISISDPTNPVLVGRLSTSGAIVAVEVDSALGYAYASGAGYLRVVDISDSSNPTTVGICALSGWTMNTQKYGNYVYLCNWTAGFEIVDVSVPTAPVSVGTCAGYGLTNLALIGNYAYAGTAVTVNNQHVLRIDVSDPTNPVAVESLTTYCTEGIHAIGSHYVLVSDGNDMLVVDVTDPDTLIEVGNYNHGGYSFHVEVSGNYAYTAGYGLGLTVMDISDTINPTLAGYYRMMPPVIEAQGPFRHGRYLYVTDYYAGLLIIEFSGDTIGYGDRFVDTLLVKAPGTADTFATIQAAVDSALPGYLVYVLAGTYREAVTFPRSGVADSVITIRGAVNMGGVPLAIIDNTTDVGATWTAASEIGAGVYKKVGYAPDLMLWNGDQIFKINQVWMAGDSGIECDKGFNILNYPADKVWYPYGAVGTSFWDDVEAVYGVLNADTTYIRFRDRLQDPDTCDLRATEVANAFRIDRSYITIEHLRIQGSSSAVLVNGSNNIIQDNVIKHGYSQIPFWSGSNNIIRRNDMTSGYGSYGRFGEWSPYAGTPVVSPEKLRTAATYSISKYMEGDGGSVHTCIDPYGGGTGTIISDNTLYKSSLGMFPSYSSDMVISGNNISEMSSVGICLGQQMHNVTVKNNTIIHTNGGIRFDRLGTDYDTISSGYIYNNRIYADTNAGSSIIFHTVQGCSANIAEGWAKPRDMWFYHNSFAGGCEGMNPARYACAWMKFVNNIFSSYEIVGNMEQADVDAETLFRAFDHNFLGGLYGYQGYLDFAATDRNNQWSADTFSGSLAHQVWPLEVVPDWLVADTGYASEAFGTALDSIFTDSFTLRGVTYPPLPGRLTAYDRMGAWGQGDTALTPTYGSVGATSTPSGASVWFDPPGVDTDSLTPCVIDSVATGQLIVKFTLAGYTDYSDTVTVTEGDTVTVNKVLQSATPSTFTIQGNPMMWWH